MAVKHASAAGAAQIAGGHESRTNDSRRTCIGRPAGRMKTRVARHYVEAAR